MHCVCMCVHIGVTQWSGNSVVLKGERWGEAWGQDSTAKKKIMLEVHGLLHKHIHYLSTSG